MKCSITVLLSLCAICARGQDRYHVTDLEVINPNAGVYAMSNSGITGIRNSNLFMGGLDGSGELISFASGAFSGGPGVVHVNGDNAVVLLTASGMPSRNRTGLWNRATGYQLLPNPVTQSGAYDQPRAINSLGTIVGWVVLEDGSGLPPQVPVKFYKDANGNYQSTILSFSGSTPYAHDVDEDDNVFGSSGGKAAFWDSNGTRHQLQSPGASWRSTAFHVRSDGVIFGQGNVYTQSTFSTEYGVLMWPNKDSAPTYYSMGVNTGPGSGFVPRSFNDFGTMVGVSTPAFATNTAAIWKASTGMRTLNSLLDSSGTGYDIYDALKINNNGQILAQARYQDDYARYVLLTPVPEPTSLLLLTPGLAWVVMRRRKKCIQ